MFEDNTMRVKIGVFDSKPIFHYTVLCFLKGDIVAQGKLVEKYLKTDNFLLIPHDGYFEEDGERNYRIGLLLTWTFAGEDSSSILHRVQDMLEDKIDVAAPLRGIVKNNGNNFYSLSNRYETQTNMMATYSDGRARNSYLITHKYENNKYVYTLNKAGSFTETISNIENPERTVLDLTFTGRRTNSYSNCYSFHNYKIKERYITDSGYVILSDVKGIIDYKKIELNLVNKTTIFNLLPGWRNPRWGCPQYYENISLDILSLIPEEKVDFKDTKLLNSMADKNMLILTKDIEILNEELRLRKSYASFPAIFDYVKNKKSSMEEIIEGFEEQRIKRNAQRIAQEREELVSYLQQARRQVKDLETRIYTLEYQTKSFIPIPKIILPTNPSNLCVDVEGLLKTKNNEYIIGEE